jgi:hypothetical protein
VALVRAGWKGPPSQAVARKLMRAGHVGALMPRLRLKNDLPTW